MYCLQKRLPEKPDLNVKQKHTTWNISENLLSICCRLKKTRASIPVRKDLTMTRRAQFAEGLIGMMFAASWDISVLTNQFPAKCDWGVAPVPAIDEASVGKYYQCQYDETSFHVTKEAAKKDATKISEVYKFLNRTDVLKKLYEEGCVLPYRTDCIKDANVKDINGWAEFGEIAKQAKSAAGWVTLKTELESESDALGKVWYGTLSIDDFIKQRTKGMNEAYQKGLSENSFNNLEELRARDVELYNRVIN